MQHEYSEESFVSVLKISFNCLEFAFNCLVFFSKTGFGNEDTKSGSSTAFNMGSKFYASRLLDFKKMNNCY